MSAHRPSAARRKLAHHASPEKTPVRANSARGARALGRRSLDGEALSDRPNVLVEAEEVVRVIAPLDGSQPVIGVAWIGLPDAVVLTVFEEVHVHSGAERPHVGP